MRKKLGEGGEEKVEGRGGELGVERGSGIM